MEAGPRITVEHARMDVPEVDALVAQAGVEIGARYPEEDAPPDDPPKAEQFMPPHGAFVLGRLDGMAVGCGGVRRIQPGVGEIKRMFTSRDARRAGVARAVLKALEDQARSLGFHTLRLETGIRQPEAMALYAGAGFRQIPCFGGYVGIDISRCFEKDLGGSPT